MNLRLSGLDKKYAVFPNFYVSGQRNESISIKNPETVIRYAVSGF